MQLDKNKAPTSSEIFFKFKNAQDYFLDKYKNQLTMKFENIYVMNRDIVITSRFMTIYVLFY